MAKLAASILSADMAHLADQVKLVEPYADSLHIDVMDGHFVPTIGVGPDVVPALRRVTDLLLHCHLMAEDPVRYFDVLADGGAGMVTSHVEALEDPGWAVSEATGHGMRAGLALNPETPADAAFPFLDELSDMIVMSVHPGWAGQAFLPEVLPKVRALRAEIDRRGLPVDIEMDGGINEETAPRCLEAGATVLAAASSIFKAPDPAAAAKWLAEIASSVP